MRRFVLPVLISLAAAIPTGARADQSATESKSEGPVFVESGGVVVIEAESTASDRGKWVLKTDVPEYTGAGHLEFTGNTKNGGPATSPLEYRFVVNEPGDYRLHIRARKRLEGEPGDKCNDGYVRINGAGDGDDAGDVAAGEGGAPAGWLTTDTKLFGGKPTEWAWASKLDRHHKKHDPIYRLQAGKQYTLTLSGRSVRWNIDRIVLRHTSVPAGKALGKTVAESARQ